VSRPDGVIPMRAWRSRRWPRFCWQRAPTSVCNSGNTKTIKMNVTL